MRKVRETLSPGGGFAALQWRVGNNGYKFRLCALPFRLFSFEWNWRIFQCAISIVSFSANAITRQARWQSRSNTQLLLNKCTERRRSRRAASRVQVRKLQFGVYIGWGEHAEWPNVEYSTEYRVHSQTPKKNCAAILPAAGSLTRLEGRPTKQDTWLTQWNQKLNYGQKYQKLRYSISWMFGGVSPTQDSFRKQSKVLNNIKSHPSMLNAALRDAYFKGAWNWLRESREPLRTRMRTFREWFRRRSRWI